MRLSKLERLYKKKLFRYLHIFSKAKQKRVSSVMVQSNLYSRGGYELIYKTLVEQIPRLTNTFKSLSKTVTDVVNTFMRFSCVCNELKGAG